MPPFAQFRLWLREGPRQERTLAGTAALVMLVVLIAALAPVGTDDGAAVDELAFGEAPAGALPGDPAAPGAAGPGSAGPAGSAGEATTAGSGATTGSDAAAGSGAAGSGAAGSGTSTSGQPAGSSAGSSGTSGGAAAPGSSGGTAANPCGNRTASAPGVTPTTVTLAMSNISLAGPIGNSTFDLRPDLEDIANAIAADINKRGGVACGRKLVLRHYDVNPINSNDTRSKCLQMVEAKPLMVLDYGGYVNPATRRCFVDAKVPLQTATAIGQTEARSGYPYLIAPSALSEQIIRNGIFGLNARGYFKPPAFKKLGVLSDACDPNVTKEMDAALAKIGIKGEQVSRFELDCAVSAPANQIQAAVLQHKNAGATHVFLSASVTNNQNYVRVAGNQDYKPVYGLSDYGASLVSPGSQNWHGTFADTVGITTLHTGEINSGIRSREVQECDRMLKAAGVPGIRSERQDTSALAYCDMFSFFVGAINNAGANPTRLSTVQGVGTMGAFKSTLLGDATFNQRGRVTGGDVQRPIIWKADCTCWKVLDRAFKPGY